MKHSLEKFTSKLDLVEERISELEDRSVEIAQFEEYREKRKKKRTEHKKPVGHIQTTNMGRMEFLKERRQGKGQK